jgi:hypothetical protein
MTSKMPLNGPHTKIVIVTNMRIAVGIPEFFENEIGESIIARTESLGKFQVILDVIKLARSRCLLTYLWPITILF